MILAQDTIVKSQTGIVIFGHTLEFWLCAVVGIVFIIGYVLEKVGERKRRITTKIETEGLTVNRLLEQKAQLMEEERDKVKEEYKLHREEAHERIEKHNADYLRAQMEITALKAKTDMTPIVTLMEKQGNVLDGMTSLIEKLCVNAGIIERRKPHEESPHS